MNSETPGFLKNRVAQKLIIGHIMETVTDEAFQDIIISSPCSTSLISQLYHDGTVNGIEYGDGEVTIKARLRKELIRKYMNSSQEGT